MRLRTRWLLALPLALPSATACSANRPAPTGAGLSLAPTIVLPQNVVITDVGQFSLSVYPTITDGGVFLGCNPDAGLLTGDASGITPTAHADGEKTGCSQGAPACFKPIAIQDSPIPYVFLVDALGKDGGMLGSGCTQAHVDAPDAETLTIDLVQAPSSAPACGNGVLGPPQTCNPAPGTPDPECNMCQTVEEVLSTGSSAGMTAGETGPMVGPSFIWPAGGQFLAFFTDETNMTHQIGMDVLDKNLAPLTSAPLSSGFVYLPNNTTQPIPSPASTDSEQQAVVTTTMGLDYVAFADQTSGDSGVTNGISLRVIQPSSLAPEQAVPCVVDAPPSGTIDSNPAIAVSPTESNEMLVAWQTLSGSVVARVMEVTGSSGACGTVSSPVAGLSTSNSTNVSVAGIENGWILVWVSNNTVTYAIVSGSGRLASGPTALTAGGTQTSASVASLSNGNFAIAWAETDPTTSKSAIYAQRYEVEIVDGGQQADEIPGDDLAPANNLTSAASSAPGEVTPFLAPMNGGNGTAMGYVLVWADAHSSSSQVHARLLAQTAGSLSESSGYLQNANGTQDEFVVSASSGDLENPTATVGGGNNTSTSPGYIAFGWEKHINGNSSIIGRRFPLPTN